MADMGSSKPPYPRLASSDDCSSSVAQCKLAAWHICTSSLVSYIGVGWKESIFTTQTNK